MRHVAANVLTLSFVVMIVAYLAIGAGMRDFVAKGPLTEDAIVSIPRGSTISDAATSLAEAGALPDRALWGVFPGETFFRLGARYQGKTASLKAGEYRVPAGSSMEEILDLVTSGRGIQFPITVPEGLTSWEVVQLLNGQDVLTGEISEIPPEGSLAPDTYNVDRGTERRVLISRMQAAQERILAQAWEERTPGLPLDSAEEALVLASIIEKETGLPEERQTVASVFINRLQRGMRLETDPTVIYGITGGKGSLGRGLRRSELVAETPYNTYRISGLPPTPIANPGRASIEAAVNPAITPYYFFVADGTGGHSFAETLAEHNVNVRNWRRIERARRAAEE